MGFLGLKGLGSLRIGTSWVFGLKGFRVFKNWNLMGLLGLKGLGSLGFRTLSGLGC